MLLRITSTHTPATELGYLLHKHPDKVQSFELTFGVGHVFYPEATAERCTAALLVDVDPVRLVRKGNGPAGDGFALQQYVNDRPYCANSFLSVALAEVFGTAMAGRCQNRPALAGIPQRWEIRLSVVPSRGGESFLRELFEPLGYQVTVEPLPLEPGFPEWGASRYFQVALTATATLQTVLGQLYVLIPVLDDDKHYWVGDDEVAKLLRHAETWLAAHPARERIIDRYLRYQRKLTTAAQAQLPSEDTPADTSEIGDAVERTVERPLRLHDLRQERVVEILRDSGVSSVLDLGCNNGRLLQRLVREPSLRRIVGVDVSLRALEQAARRFNLVTATTSSNERLQLWHGSLTYRDRRLEGFAAAVLVEVIEHFDPHRLHDVEQAVFGYARPRLIVVTTPNVEYNVRFPGLAPGQLRHGDHRFEWTRAEFESWANRVATEFGYTVLFEPLGPVDPEVGAPSQLAIFEQQPGAGP